MSHSGGLLQLFPGFEALLKKQQVGLSMRDFNITIARTDGQSRRPILRHEIVNANSIAHAETKSGDLIRNDEQLLGICLATRRRGSLLKRYAALCFDCEKTGLHTSIETLERFGAIHAGHDTLFATPKSDEEIEEMRRDAAARMRALLRT
jgi:hypothetical protein